jgi:hypothetical protein
VLLHGVRRDDELFGDLGGGSALQDQAGHVTFARDQLVGGFEQRVEAGGVGRLHDDGDAVGGSRTLVADSRAMASAVRQFASVLSHRSAVGLAAWAGGCSYCDSC